MSNLTNFSFKIAPQMLERWRAAARRRRVPLAQMIRDAVNRDIEAEERKRRS